MSRPNAPTRIASATFRTLFVKGQKRGAVKMRRLLSLIFVRLARITEWRQLMTDELTREELLQMVAAQMRTIHEMQTQITEALQAIDNGCPDLAWRKLLLVQERFR